MGQQIKLYRRYKDGYTPGVMTIGDRTIFTIERPWIPTPEHVGGKNRESCIPEGEYLVQPYSSIKFPLAWCLTNPSLDVHLWPADGVLGRSAILIHAGNKVADVVGCIAVGLAHASDRRLVLKSREAIEVMRDVLGRKDSHKLIIGAYNGVSGLVTGVQDSGSGSPSSGGGSEDVGPRGSAV